MKMKIVKSEITEIECEKDIQALEYFNRQVISCLRNGYVITEFEANTCVLENKEDNKRFSIILYKDKDLK